MLDYEKLRVANELCLLLDDYYFSVDFCVNRKSDKCDITLTNANVGEPEPIFDIDDLIDRLKWLTQPKLIASNVTRYNPIRPKPKYAVDDEVWVLSGREFIDARVDVVIPYEGTYKYQLAFDYAYIPDDVPPQIEFEYDLFPSPEALIDAQIEYWQSLRDSAQSSCNSGECLKKDDKSTGSDDVSMESTASNPNGDCMGVTCEHELDVSAVWYGKSEWNGKCKHCGEFYR